MVSKCANPDCSTSFRYFHQGKLYRIETDVRADRRRGTLGAESPMKRLEFYWLCDTCAEEFTLVYDRKSGVVLRPREPEQAAAS